MPRRLDPIWYRLLIRAPFDVVFPSITYHVLEPELAPGRPAHWELAAKGQHCYPGISEYFRRRDWLDQALYVDGFCTRWATVGHTIMDRCVKVGYAVKMPAPVVLPENGRGRPWMAP